MCKEPLKGLLKHLFGWKEQGQIELLMIKVKGNYSSVTWFPLICHLDMVIIHVFYWVSCCPNKGSLTFHCHSSVQLAFCQPVIDRISYLRQAPRLPPNLWGKAELAWLMSSTQLCFIHQYISRGGHGTWNNVIFSVFLIYAIFNIQVNRNWWYR